MDVCELDQALAKHSVVETPRPQLGPAERNNGTTLRSRTREISSRYRSPTPSTASGPRRFPSPNTTRTGMANSVSAPKRAISAERRRPSTPSSPANPSTPVHHTATVMQLASRKVMDSRLPESLWPSTMRSLNVSFQSDTFSVPISKREKPSSHSQSDRTLRPSTNVAHKQSESTVSRKQTPERKRSPLKGKNSPDKSENSKPGDGLHGRSVDQHRWPSRMGGRVSSSALAKSIIDISDKTTKATSTPNPVMTSPSLRRMSTRGGLNKHLQKSASDEMKLISVDGSGKVEFEACAVDDKSPRIPKVVSSRSLERTKLVTSNDRSQSLPTPGSRPASPNMTSLLLSSVCRGASPSRTRTLGSTPSRGVSPSRTRSSSPTTQANSSTSVLSYMADIRKGKKVANHIEDVHRLRLLYNRHLQWRYANARADVTLSYQKVTAEKGLYNVWRTTSELRNSVTEKRIDLQQMRLKLKLYSVLNEQVAHLEEWPSIEKAHNLALSGAIKDLQASTLRLPVSGGAMADIDTVKAAVCSAVNVMQTMGSSLCPVLAKVDGMNCLISELANVAAQERATLDECEALLATTTALLVKEYSIRTHLVQSKS